MIEKINYTCEKCGGGRRLLYGVGAKSIYACMDCNRVEMNNYFGPGTVYLVPESNAASNFSPVVPRST